MTLAAFRRGLAALIRGISLERPALSIGWQNFGHAPIRALIERENRGRLSGSETTLRALPISSRPVGTVGSPIVSIPFTRARIPSAAVIASLFDSAKPPDGPNSRGRLLVEKASRRNSPVQSELPFASAISRLLEFEASNGPTGDSRDHRRKFESAFAK